MSLPEMFSQRVSPISANEEEYQLKSFNEEADLHSAAGNDQGRGETRYSI